MKAIKRACTKDGGSLIKVRNEKGKIDTTTITASILRAIILILLLYLASILGVPLPIA